VTTEELTRAIDRLDELDRAAAQALNAGRLEDAERVWAEMHAIAPRNRNALWGLGYAALQRGDAVRARAFLQAAREAAPHDKIVLMTLAKACRNCKDPNGEVAAISAVLALDPKYLPALLAKGALLERHKHADAVPAYIAALDTAPASPEHWPDDCRDLLHRAKAAVDRHKTALFNALSENIARISGDDASDGRWREAASIMSKLSKPYNAEPHRLYVPRMPAKPFHDPAQFSWVKALEAKTGVIRDELMRALQTKGQDFVPYVNLGGGPSEEWRELNCSTRWSVFYLWMAGARDEENLALCPETAKALEQVDQAHIRGNCPNAMFSALAPRTHIPPHTGESNARLVVHLPLIVPENCGSLRVGFEQRAWRVGEAMIFDDSIEHEAWNNSDELRVVLLFDVWNPQLTQQDREIVNTLVSTEADFAKSRVLA